MQGSMYLLSELNVYQQPVVAHRHGSNLDMHIRTSPSMYAQESTTAIIPEANMSLQCDDKAYDQNEQMLDRLMAVDDIDSVHTNCAGLA